MSRRTRLDLRAKMVQDTELFLNRALGSNIDANQPASSRQLMGIIERFLTQVNRLAKLKSLRSKKSVASRTGR